MAGQETVATPTPTCVNCGEPGTVKTDGISADELVFCDRHKPDQATGLLPL